MASCHHRIARCTLTLNGGLIALCCRQIASVGTCIAANGCDGTHLRGQAAVAGSTIAEITRVRVDARIATLCELAIACLLIQAGGHAVAVGRSLVAVGRSLVGIRRGRDAPRSRGDARAASRAGGRARVCQVRRWCVLRMGYRNPVTQAARAYSGSARRGDLIWRRCSPSAGCSPGVVRRPRGIDGRS